MNFHLLQKYKVFTKGKHFSTSSNKEAYSPPFNDGSRNFNMWGQNHML